MIVRRAGMSGMARGMVAVCLVALVVSGCRDHESPADVTASPKVTVAVGESAYRPGHVRIETGWRVTFVNPTVAHHTAETGGIDTFEYDREELDRENRFDTHVLEQGEAESVEFDTPGIYEFWSSSDPAMKGSVTVLQPPS